MRHCKYKCTHLGKMVTLYQDGPVSPLGVIAWRCPECGLYDHEFPPRKVMESMAREHQLERKAND
jgi:hypothetical protein